MAPAILHLLDGLVYDGVQAYVNAVALGKAAGGKRRAHLETYDEGIGCSRQRHVAFGNCAHGLMYHIHLHLGR